MEEWRDIEGFGDLYEVSRDGWVRNKRSALVLRAQCNPSGTLFVLLRSPGALRGCKTVRVDALVEKAFVK